MLDYRSSDEHLYSIFDDMSDGLIIVGPEKSVLYSNPAFQSFPKHLKARVVNMCGPSQCRCDGTDPQSLIEQSQLEGWTIKCHAFGINQLLIVKYDNLLGDRIKSLREDFAAEIAKGITPSMAALQVLRHHVGARWISIGHVDHAKGQICFDLAFEGDTLLRNALPPFHRNEAFKFCKSMAVTSRLEECFDNTAAHRDLGIAHIIGMVLKNDRSECIGYALLADDHVPAHLNETVTLLQELAVLYGPYFEIGSARKEVQKAQADAHLDVVTGKGNRRAFEAYIQECLADLAHETHDSDVLAMLDPDSMRNSLMMIVDLDGFKRVNDSLGHAEGDRALRLVAEELEKMEPRGSVFRIGGDEFVQVFTNAGDLDSDDLRMKVNLIEDEIKTQGFDGLGLSMGVVHFFEGDGSLASLTALADARMYHDKKLRSLAFI